MTDPLSPPASNDFAVSVQFTGMRVIESVYLVENGTPYEVRRSWWARLFTRPWIPWQATTTVVPQVPYRGAIQLDARTVVMHPATLKQVRDLV